jgi:hypothetical protein
MDSTTQHTTDDIDSSTLRHSSDFEFAVAGGVAAAPVNPFIIPQNSGEDSWMFDPYSVRSKTAIGRIQPVLASH